MDGMNKGIKDIKNIYLTKNEKKNIFEMVMKTPVVSPYAPKTIWKLSRYIGHLHMRLPRCLHLSWPEAGLHMPPKARCRAIFFIP